VTNNTECQKVLCIDRDIKRLNSYDFESFRLKLNRPFCFQIHRCINDYRVACYRSWVYSQSSQTRDYIIVIYTKTVVGLVYLEK